MAQIALNYSAAQINAAIAKINSLVSVIEGSIVQLYDGTTAIYPRTKAEAVFFDNDTSKTLDQQFSQLEQKVIKYDFSILGKDFEWADGYYLNYEDGTAIAYSGSWMCTDYIEINISLYDNTLAKFTGICSGNVVASICFYDINYNYLGGIRASNYNNQSISLPKDTKYVRLCSYGTLTIANNTSFGIFNSDYLNSNYISGYNVSLHHKNYIAPSESERYGTDIFTLSEALQTIPTQFRQNRLTIIFKNKANSFISYIFVGQGDFEGTNNWSYKEEQPIIFNLTKWCQDNSNLGTYPNYFTLQSALDFLLARFSDYISTYNFICGSILTFATSESKFETWQIQLSSYSLESFSNVSNWKLLSQEEDITHQETFGQIYDTIYGYSNPPKYYISIKDNIVNKYNQVVSIAIKFGQWNKMILAIIDHDTRELLAQSYIVQTPNTTLTLTAEQLPYNVNISERRCGIWLGGIESAFGVPYSLSSGCIGLTYDRQTLTEISGVDISLQIVKKVLSTKDSFTENINIESIVCGNRGLTGSGADGSYYSCRDNIINKFNQFVNLKTTPVASGTLVAALVDEDSGAIIETQSFVVENGVEFTIVPTDFDYDINGSFKNIGIYIKENSRGLSFISITSTSGQLGDKNYNNGVIIQVPYYFDIKIEKIAILPESIIPNVAEELEKQIDALEVEIGTGGVISDLQDYITNHRNVFLGSGTYTINTPLNIPNNTKIVGIRGQSVIQLGSADIIANLTAKQNITFEDVTFIGKVAHSSHTSLGSTDAERIAAIKARTGQGTDKGFYIAGEANAILFTRCEFLNFGYSGLHFKSTHTGSSPFYRKFKVTDCEFHHSWYGMMVDERCEFSAFVGNTFAYNEIGCFVDGGNNYFGVCHFDMNYINVVVSGVSHNNDTHGSMTCCSMNHSTIYGLMCVEVNNGYLFNGCMLYEKGILLDETKGFSWNAGHISGKIIVVDEPINQTSLIHNTTFGKAYSYGIEGNPQHLSLLGNRYENGDDSSDINNNI